MEMINIHEILEQVIDFSISKYGAFLLAICTFLFPVALYLKCKYEEYKIGKFRKDAILRITKDDDYTIVQDEATIVVSQSSVLDYDLINQLFKEKLGIQKDYIQNGKPLLSDDSVIIPWQRLFRSYDVYNKALCSGFWSLFLSRAKKEVYTKVGFIQYFENASKTKSIVLFELVHGEFSIIYRVNLKQPN